MKAKSHVSKFALVGSVVALVLCFAMLFGTTYAWFSDREVSGRNKIIGGNLDVGLQYYDYDATTPEWKNVDEYSKLFIDNALWEPGHVEVAYVKVANLGTLALHYNFRAYPFNETGSISVLGNQFKLSDYLMAAAVELHADNNGGYPTFETREDALEAATAPIVLGNLDVIVTGDLYPTQAAYDTVVETGTHPGNVPEVRTPNEKAYAIVVWMPEEVGNEANYDKAGGKNAPTIDIGFVIEATQTPFESDSFDDQYDKNADGTPDYAEFVKKFHVSTTEDIVAALNEATADNTVEIILDEDIDDGPGIKTVASAPKHIILDLNGNTYTNIGPAVGSPNTESQCFHFEKGSTVVIKNGNLVNDCASASMFIQNYGDLTLENVVITHNNDYAVSCNNGTIVFASGTELHVPDGKIAFDLCFTSHYPDGAHITVEDGVIINGKVQFDKWGTMPDPIKCYLIINGGNFLKGYVVTDLDPEVVKQYVTINGGNFAW